MKLYNKPALIGLFLGMALVVCVAATYQSYRSSVAILRAGSLTVDGTSTFASTVGVTGQTTLVRVAASSATMTSETATRLTAGSVAIGSGTRITKLMVGSCDVAASVSTQTATGLLPGDKVWPCVNSACGVTLYSVVATTDGLQVTFSDTPATTVTLPWLCLRE